ncbi:hydroxyphenylacetyl-CoA thioesterase PaaI [Acinetobacter stercoris]|uniref:Acyl-coenzyme A thioesterase PaaI n=1 Tax=Acinetobacter stercoris TaxID=2126983 RepID=A0A2U3N1J9_9GAMM|nr:MULTISPECIES: hydroxyphenylacetyl-CoA thioesterase PaaI [Acinetobacter]SPL71495.1 Acyl-coenzyme A thioesterase PaaI [Acinetobacter stercoris]
MDVLKGHALFNNDQVMQEIGADLVEFKEQYAKVQLLIEKRHTQGYGTCHGGTIFALADGAFAVACNTGEYPAVGQHCTISYLKPGKIGDTLTATAIFKAPSGRSEIYDISVTNQNGEIIAEFRGVSRMVIPKK